MKKQEKPVVYLMIDLETYATDPFAVIRQIACIPFSIKGLTVEMHTHLYFNAFVKTDKQTQRVKDKATLAWWSQPEMAEVDAEIKKREQLIGMEPEEAASRFVAYLNALKKRFSLRFLGRGANTFDIPILKNFCDMYGVKFAVPYYHVFDTRSFVKICCAFAGRDVTTKVEGKHNAFVDCAVQIKELHDCLVGFGLGAAEFKNSSYFLDPFRDEGDFKKTLEVLSRIQDFE